MPIQKIKALIEQHGLVSSSFAFNDLPNSVKQKLRDACNTHFDNCYVLLLANAGSEFWQVLTSPDRNKEVSGNEVSGNKATGKDVLNNDPVDNFSIAIAKQIIAAGEQTQDAQIVYPGYPVPLIKLGELSGWSTPSPLGLGLHPEYGPWFAYRALIKSTEPLQPVQTLKDIANASSPCLSCADAPCVSACPASATSKDKVFDIDRCVSQRLAADSTCETQCHARNACPVGQAYRYSEQQREYHMTHALDALREWSTLSKRD